MASLHHHLLLLLPVLLSLSLSLPRTANGDLQLIKDTCSKTSFSDFCMSTLLSNTSSSTADAKGLAGIVISAAISNSTDSAALIMEIAKKQKDGEYATLLEDCHEEYNDSAEFLGNALGRLAANDFEGAAALINQAAFYVHDCKRMILGQDLPYPPEVASRETTVGNLDVVALNITAQLH